MPEKSVLPGIDVFQLASHIALTAETAEFFV